MKRVFAILQEPASYTVDRNRAIYDKLGIRYCYINSISEAKSDCNNVVGLSELSSYELNNQLDEILRDNDIIIINGYTGPVFRKLYLLNYKYKRVIGIDSDTQLRIPENPFRRLVKWGWLSVVFRNKYYYGLAGGTGSHMDLFRHYGMPESRICLMPMMVNNKRFERSNSTYPMSVFRFLYVGRFVSAKNIPLMLDAFVSAYGDNSNVELRLVGKGEMTSQLIEKYSKYQNIVFAGAKYEDALIKEYHEASTLILPSSYEPWGLVVNEAMASGLPVIVSNRVGAAYDLVKDKHTGLIFEYNNKNSLVECMKKLVEDKALHQLYSDNAKTFMKKEWNYHLYTNCLVRFIDKASEKK